MDKKYQTLKILIVEDDEISQLLLNIMVEEIDCEVINTNTGYEAIEICRNNPDIDVVLMDIKMPKMNGYEATQQIRRFNKNIKIVAQTAYNMPDDIEKSMNAGCDAHLSKPIDEYELMSLIKNFNTTPNSQEISN